MGAGGKREPMVTPATPPTKPTPCDLALALIVAACVGSVGRRKQAKQHDPGAFRQLRGTGLAAKNTAYNRDDSVGLRR